jgi:hypothetical protein
LRDGETAGRTENGRTGQQSLTHRVPPAFAGQFDPALVATQFL